MSNDRQPIAHLELLSENGTSFYSGFPSDELMKALKPFCSVSEKDGDLFYVLDRTHLEVRDFVIR